MATTRQRRASPGGLNQTEAQRELERVRVRRWQVRLSIPPPTHAVAEFAAWRLQAYLDARRAMLQQLYEPQWRAAYAVKVYVAPRDWHAVRAVNDALARLVAEVLDCEAQIRVICIPDPVLEDAILLKVREK